ncbi:MAG: PAS domain-containing sensor histidine kinase [Chitinophagaceae bacterium]
MPTNISHLTSLFENATEGIILTDSKGTIVMVNPSAERMFGYDSGEIIGSPIEILIPDNVRPHHHTLREGFYHKPSNRVMGQGRDLYGKKKDGNGIPVEVSLSHYKRDEEIFVIAFIVDITKRKESESNMIRQQKELEKISNEIRKLNADLETKVEERTLILKEALQRLEESQTELNEALGKERQLNEIKSRFVSMASHEFRTPLSTVLSSASLLSKYTSTEEQDKRDRHIEKIKTSVKHLNDILEDFLSLGKLDEGRMETHICDFNLNEFLVDVIDELNGMLKTGQFISLTYTGINDFSTDKQLLQNILINLVTNAVKFSPDNSEIGINASTTDKEAVITVQDHGIGIATDDIEHLFSSFFRGGNATNIQGTGLGLHIVKRYLGLIEGNVKVDSTLGQGTTITLIILNHKPTI